MHETLGPLLSRPSPSVSSWQDAKEAEQRAKEEAEAKKKAEEEQAKEEKEAAGGGGCWCSSELPRKSATHALHS